MHIYVGDLAFAVTEAGLRAACEAYGAVDAVRSITDQSSGQSTGCGFVGMPAASDAQAAIAGLQAGGASNDPPCGAPDPGAGSPTAPRSRPFG
jgi:RNA recognition motif-containing protein